MSVVTSIALTCSLGEALNWAEKPPGNVALINAWLAARKFGPLTDCARLASAGDKYPQFLMYLAGYNHFPEDDFVAFFRTVEWENPENVVLVLKPEDGRTRIYRPEH